MIELSIKKTACCVLFAFGMTTIANAQVAKVGDVEYQTLTEAIAGAATNSTITVLADIDTPDKLYTVENKTLTIDINGKNINSSGVRANTGAVLTLKDGTAQSLPVVSDDYKTITYIAGTLTVKNSISANNGGEIIVESGKLLCKQGTLLGSNGDMTGTTEINSIVTVNGGYLESQEFTVESEGKGAVANVNGGVLVANDNAVVGGNGTNKEGNKRGGTTINITGGTMIGHIITNGYVACGVYHPQEGVLNISGDNTKIVALGGCGVLMRGGKANITGSTIIATGESNLVGKVGDSRVVVGPTGVIFDRDANYYDAANVSVSISGNNTNISGTKQSIEVVNTKNYANADNAISVIGGKYNSDVTDFCPAGSATSKGQDGEYTLVSGDIIVAHPDGTKSVTKLEDGKLEFNTQDMTKLTIAKEMTNVDVKMEKTYSTTNWISFFAPFDIVATDNVLQKFELATIEASQEKDEAISIDCKSATNGQKIAAGTPCLIKSKTAGANVLELTGVDITTANGGSISKQVGDMTLTFTGVTANTTLLDKYGYYLNAKEQIFRPVSEPTAYIKPMTFYLTIKDKDGKYVYPGNDNDAAAAKSIMLNVEDGETTGVSEISTVKTAANKVYNLQGVYVGNNADVLPAGMYIVNGKKIVKK